MTDILQDPFMLRMICLAAAFIGTGVVLMCTNRGASTLTNIIAIVLIAGGGIFIALACTTQRNGGTHNYYAAAIEESSGMRVLGGLSAEQSDKIAAGGEFTDVLLVDDSDGTVYNCKVENNKGDIAAYFEVKKGRYIKLDQLAGEDTAKQ